MKEATHTKAIHLKFKNTARKLVFHIIPRLIENRVIPIEYPRPFQAVLYNPIVQEVTEPNVANKHWRINR